MLLSFQFNHSKRNTFPKVGKQKKKKHFELFLCELNIFCSLDRCQDDFQMRTSQTYMRSRVLEVEQGTCQHCGLHAHDLFLKVRDAPPSKRKEMLENTWLAQLSVKEVRAMSFYFPSVKVLSKPCSIVEHTIQRKGCIFAPFFPCKQGN